MKVTTHHSERRVNYVREDCTAERGSHHKQPKELVRRSAKMPNIFLHAEADEPIQTAALLGHLWLGLVRVCYVVKNSKNNHLKIFLFVVRADCTGISKKAGWARLHFRRSLPRIKVLLTRTVLCKKNPVKWAPWLDSLVAAMWFEHMTLRVWKIKIGNKRHGWRGGCETIEDGSFVWIKHIYEYSKLTEISTVWKSRIVQNEVYTCEKHLSFNTKKQCAKNALCFFFLHDFIHTIFRAESTPPLHPPAHRIRSAK